MLGLTNNTRVFLKTSVTDGRLGADALKGLVTKVIREDPHRGHLFCFCNGAKNRIKLLWWDGTGFFIAGKRLPRGTYDFPKNEMAVSRMSPAQLDVLLKGVDFRPNGGYRR